MSKGVAHAHNTESGCQVRRFRREGTGTQPGRLEKDRPADSSLYKQLIADYDNVLIIACGRNQILIQVQI